MTSVLNPASSARVAEPQPSPVQQDVQQLPQDAPAAQSSAVTAAQTGALAASPKQPKQQLVQTDGMQTKADGQQSPAEGVQRQVDGQQSPAEGVECPLSTRHFPVERTRSGEEGQPSEKRQRQLSPEEQQQPSSQQGQQLACLELSSLQPSAAVQTQAVHRETTRHPEGALPDVAGSQEAALGGNKRQRQPTPPPGATFPLEAGRDRVNSSGEGSVSVDRAGPSSP